MMTTKIKINLLQDIDDFYVYGNDGDGEKMTKLILKKGDNVLVLPKWQVKDLVDGLSGYAEKNIINYIKIL